MIDYESLELAEVRRIHDGGVTAIAIGTRFAMASSVARSIRLYSPAFDQLVTEVKTSAPVSYADMDSDGSHIAVFQYSGALSILSIKEGTFITIM